MKVLDPDCINLGDVVKSDVRMMRQNYAFIQVHTVHSEFTVVDTINNTHYGDDPDHPYSYSRLVLNRKSALELIEKLKEALGTNQHSPLPESIVINGIYYTMD